MWIWLLGLGGVLAGLLPAAGVPADWPQAGATDLPILLTLCALAWWKPRGAAFAATGLAMGSVVGLVVAPMTDVRYFLQIGIFLLVMPLTSRMKEYKERRAATVGPRVVLKARGYANQLMITVPGGPGVAIVRQDGSLRFEMDGGGSHTIPRTCIKSVEPAGTGELEIGFTPTIMLLNVTVQVESAEASKWSSLLLGSTSVTD